MAGFLVDFLGTVVGAELLDRLLEITARLEQEARGGKVLAGERSVDVHLPGNAGHASPVVEHMGDTMLLQHLKVRGTEEARVADFHAILPALWKLGEKDIELIHEIAAALEVTRVEMAELEYQNTDPVPIRFA